MKNLILDWIKEINQSQTNIELNDLDCKTKTRKKYNFSKTLWPILLLLKNKLSYSNN